MEDCRNFSLAGVARVGVPFGSTIEGWPSPWGFDRICMVAMRLRLECVGCVSGTAAATGPGMRITECKFCRERLNLLTTDGYVYVKKKNERMEISCKDCGYEKQKCREQNDK